MALTFLVISIRRKWWMSTTPASFQGRFVPSYFRHPFFFLQCGEKATLGQREITDLRVKRNISSTLLRYMIRSSGSRDFSFLAAFQSTRRKNHFRKGGFYVCVPVFASRCSPWIKWMPFRTFTAPSRQMWRPTCWSVVPSSSPPSVPLSKNIPASDTEGKSSQKSFCNQIFHLCVVCSCGSRYEVCVHF